VRNFGKLLNYEMRRLRYVLAGLMGLTAFIQLGTFLWKTTGDVAIRQEQLARSNGAETFLPDMTFAELMNSLQGWFIPPVFLCIAVMVIYVFLIWYRDWFSRDTFIYRLLMLPAARRNIYLSKLSAILLSVFSLLAFQLVLIVVLRWLFHVIVPAEFREHSYFADALLTNQAWELLLPRNLWDFLFSYGLGTLGVIVVFTAILLERSYRGVGIFYGIGYVVLAFVALMWPFVFLGLSSFFYPSEVAAIGLFMAAVVAVVSLWLGFRLLHRKITV